jgi:histidine phosphotransferase ChpT
VKGFMSDQILIAELLCARFSHDITGPVGAVNNGAEFLEEEEFEMGGEALKLITDSAKEAIHRLQFYRKAYGYLKEEGGACLDDKKSLTANFLQHTRIDLDWPDTHTDAADIPVSHATARLLLNCIIIVAGSLIRGGILKVRIGKDDESKNITITGTGPDARLEEYVTEMLDYDKDIPEETLTPRNVQVYLTRELARKTGTKLSIRHDEQMIEIMVRKS